MGAHRRQHDDEERREGVGSRSARSPAPGTSEPAATLLDLQSRAGNAAVTGLLAGDGPTVLRHAIQRAKGGEAAAAKDEGTRPASPMLAIPGLAVTIPLQSLAWNRGSVAGGGSAGARSPDSGPADVRIGIALDDTALQMQAAAASGRVFATMTITTPAFRLVLAEVLIAAFSVGTASVGAATVSVTLNASSISMQVSE